jgi:hypothetical protein
MMGSYKFKLKFTIRDIASITVPKRNKTFFKLDIKKE